MSYFITLFILSSLVATSNQQRKNVAPKITKLECVNNKKFCKQYYCTISVVRKKLDVLDMNCVIEKNITDCKVSLTVAMKMRGKYNKIFEVNENVCEVLKKNSFSPVSVRIAEVLGHYLNIPKRCPMTGNFTLRRYPVDMTVFPVAIPVGDYTAFMRFDELVNKTSTSSLDIRTYLSVR